MKSLPRLISRQKLIQFISSEGAGLVFVQGRRRVGKTWLLQEIEELNKSRAFRLVCRKHRRDSVLLKDFAEAWADRSGQTELSLMRPSSLTWKRLMTEIGRFAVEYKKTTGENFVLIIDEVQWLSTGYEESAGVVKAAWDVPCHSG